MDSAGWFSLDLSGIRDDERQINPRAARREEMKNEGTMPGYTHTHTPTHTDTLSPAAPLSMFRYHSSFFFTYRPVALEFSVLAQTAADIVFRLCTAASFN